MKLLLKWKIWRIELALKKLIRAEGYDPIVWSYGAYCINSKHLVFVVGVLTDKAKNSLKGNDLFTDSLKGLLERYNWPERARASVVFDIESQETVEREANGNWWHHYK